MSRPLAMWIERAYETRLRGHRYHLSGPILGRAPEVGDALALQGLFDTIPMRCRQLLGEARGAEGAAFTLGVDVIKAVPPSHLRGAFLVEDGVAVRRFGARLRARRPMVRTTARFELRDGHAWGLVSIRGDALNVVVVGGGLGREVLWPVLQEIRLESGERLSTGDFASPVAEHASRWTLTPARNYVRDDDARAFVVPAIGPVQSNSWQTVWVGASERPSHLIQQLNGVTQFVVPNAALIEAESLSVEWRQAA